MIVWGIDEDRVVDAPTREIDLPIPSRVFIDGWGSWSRSRDDLRFVFNTSGDGISKGGQDCSVYHLMD